MDYIIKEDLRDSLIGLIIIIEKASEDDKLILSDGKIFNVPFLNEMKNDLKNLEIKNG